MAFEKWVVNGYDLSSLAHEILTYDGLDDVPDMVVEDVPRAQDHGVDPGVGYFGVGRKAVSMLVRTTAVDGTTASTPDGQRAIYDANLDTLMRVFYRRKLLDVQRTLSDGTTRRADCRVVSGIQPKTVGLSAGMVAFDLQLPYSFWEATEDVEQFVPGTLSNYALVAFKNATAPLNELEYDIIGPALNPRITDPETGAWVQVNGSIASGVTVTLKNKDQTVTGASLTAVDHQGDPRWLTLYPSPSGVLMTFNGGNPDARLVVRGRPKFLR